MPSSVQVALKPIDMPSIGRNNYQKFGFREEVLPKGWNGYNLRPLPYDIHVSHDVGITVRDGCTLYCDIYRPTNATTVVPAILAWSPFGKKFNRISMLQNLPWNMGVRVPKGVLSGLEKFEGPDPAVFVPRGFAIVNVDARGSGDSDGSVAIMGTQEGRGWVRCYRDDCKTTMVQWECRIGGQLPSSNCSMVHCGTQTTISKSNCSVGSM